MLKEDISKLEIDYLKRFCLEWGMDFKNLDKPESLNEKILD